MQRSPGITVSAVLIFVGSGLTLLVALLAALSIALLHATKSPQGPPSSVIGLSAFFYLGLSAWGIASGVSVLRLREWARISVIIFAAFLALGAFGAVAMMPFMPLPPSGDADSASMFKLFIHGTEIFFSALGALGVWWLYYFNKPSIRAEFRQPQSLAVAIPGFAIPPGSPVGGFVVPPAATSPARPVSISVIAAMLLLGAAMLPINLLYRTPLMFFSYLISGWHALVFGALLSVASLAAGVGLFKLKLWARTLAIGIAIFGVLNSLASILIPGSQSRWDQAMQASLDKWGVRPGMSMPHLPVWLPMLSVLPIALIELYFLITRKPAFLAQSSHR
ncbi:MAG TPA: hypothetical protein VGD60_03270 [Candidatus Acidoferrales bacterium]